MMSFNPGLLDAYREKWREVPGGSDTDHRRFSTDLLALPDPQMLTLWEAEAASRASGVIGWVGPLYRPLFTGRRVLEIGSGLGLDGMRFAAQGAAWTFADIVPDNLEFLRRVARLKGVTASFHLIGDDLSFGGLDEFDAIYACGSLHHVPFDVARAECLDALRHLAPNGRWIELVYPRERWAREGSPAFDHWGRMTDGDRTPWAEWYDAEKLQHRLAPAQFRTILDFNFRDDHFKWLDLEHR